MALSKINDWQTRLINNYAAVLDPATYPTDHPHRRSMYPHERLVLDSCLEHLALTGEEYIDQIQRCDPLSENTKQSVEINEEDHGKEILIFTVVTIIFLPLSFVTSYLGMNTSDIRDMESTQSLFWTIAIPLTAVVMGTIFIVAYNGDKLRKRISDSYRSLTGKQDQSSSAQVMSLAEHKRALKRKRGFDSSSSSMDYKGLTDEAEYTAPRLEWNDGGYLGGSDAQMRSYSPPRPNARMQSYSHSRPPPPQSGPRPYSPPHGHPPYDIPNHHRPSFLSDHLPYGIPAVQTNPFLPTRVQQRRTRILTSSPLATLPSFIRLHRKQITPETLAHFALPWEVDPKDADYVLIKRSLDPRALDEVLAHTREQKEKEWREKQYARLRRRNERRRDERGHEGAEGEGVEGETVCETEEKE
jgi:hypothetical protein